MGEMPAEPAAGRCAAAGRVRLIAALMGGVLLLAALLVLGRELIAARVPQQRAALEELIRHESGLEITFSRLSVRWGWYGPEAVFHAVTLGEPQAPAFLRATELVVGLDAWRSVRSGQLEAGRIGLVDPDIDLGGRGALAGAARPQAAAPAEILADARRVLGRWRGGRIDIQGGSVRWPAPAGAAPLLINLRRAELRRLGADWSADAELLLPQALGGSAQLGLRLSGELARPQELSGTLTFSATGLSFAGWRELKITALPMRYLPRAGGGDLQLRASFARGARSALPAPCGPSRWNGSRGPRRLPHCCCRACTPTGNSVARATPGASAWPHWIWGPARTAPLTFCSRATRHAVTCTRSR